MSDEVVRCPECGQAAELVGLSNQNYPAAFRCYNYRRHHNGEYNFSGNDPRIDHRLVERVERASRALSRLNAFKMRTKT